MLSKYQLQILDDNNFSFKENKKLIPNLEAKGIYNTPNGWVFVYELRGCGFESRCSQKLKLDLNTGLQ